MNNDSTRGRPLLPPGIAASIPLAFTRSRLLAGAVALGAFVLLSACGGGGNGGWAGLAASTPSPASPAAPEAPPQTCSMTGPVSAGALVTRACDTPSFTVSGQVSGLDGVGLVLQNNAGDEISIAGDGAFSFPTPVALGGSYAVMVKTQPKRVEQICTVSSGAGTMPAGNVTDVVVACASRPAKALYVGFNPAGMTSGLIGYQTDAMGGYTGTLVVSGAYGSFPPVESIVFNEDKRMLYMIAGTEITSQSIGADQSLTFAGLTPIPSGLTRALLDPLGRSLFLLDGAAGLLRVYELGVSGRPTGNWTDAMLPGISQSAMAADPAGRFLYIANSMSANISQLPISPDGLAVGSAAAFPSAMGTTSLAVDPTGRFLYAASNIAGEVHKYDIDPQTGALSNQTDYTLADASLLAVHPSGNSLYVVSNTAGLAMVNGYSIDPADGSLTARSAVNTSAAEPAAAMVMDPAGHRLTVVTASAAESVHVDKLGGHNGATSIAFMGGFVGARLAMTR